MLAVLPVQNMTGDPSLEYVSDGLTEEIITELSILNPSRIGVIARTSSMAYKRTDKTVDRIGKELGVDYVLETSVRQSGSGFRVTTQLILVQLPCIWVAKFGRRRAGIARPEHSHYSSPLANCQRKRNVKLTTDIPRSWIEGFVAHEPK